MMPESWVIVHAATKQPILRTRNKRMADKLNEKKFKSIPAAEYDAQQKEVKDNGNTRRSGN